MAAHSLSDYGPRLMGDQRLPTSRNEGPFFAQLPLLFSNSSPPFWANVVNSFSLASAHARPAQSSPKIFKHP
jgi:hypothetical protein